jgi:arylsulfatase A-like enzyme
MVAAGFLGCGRSRAPEPPKDAPAWVSRIDQRTLASRPNILLVVYDARRRDDFSFGPFGNQRHDTPFLADFAKSAIYFEDAVAPGCWTVPVHASIFSGLSVCELGIDYYNPGVFAFDDSFLSLAQILGASGYRTIAYADHPYFFHQKVDLSLVRGFQQFDVTNDYEDYASFTNIATPSGRVEKVQRLADMGAVPPQLVTQWLKAFESGEMRFDLEAEADHDPAIGAYFAKLPRMFRLSPYFTKRYGELVHLLSQDAERPYFLFVNLHMCTLAMPDPVLFSSWYLKSLMLTAQASGRSLSLGSEGDDVFERLEGSCRELGIEVKPFEDCSKLMKHVFDNRFYDATFEMLWNQLERLQETRNTATIVVSDHGLSLDEEGEGIYLHAGGRPHETLTRVPLLLRLPDDDSRRSLNGSYSQRVSLTDLFPTMVELGIGPGVLSRRQPIHGRSLLTRLERQEFEPFLVVEASLRPESYRRWPSVAGYSKAIYEGPLKLIYAPKLWRMGKDAWPLAARLEEKWPFSAPRPSYEMLDEPLSLLFDLSKDPTERHDLAPSRPDDVERLRSLVDTWSCRPLDSTQSIPQWNPQAMETLRALGYVE